MSERRRRFTKALYGFDAVVRRVPDDAWGRVSPCPGWTARAVTGHMIFGARMLAVITGVGEQPTGSEEDVATEDPATAWAAALDDTLEGLDGPGVLEQEAETPFGRMTIERFAGIFAVEPLIHTWDLAMATGVDPALDADLCERGLRQVVKAGDMLRGPGLYGPPVAVGESADIASRFIALTGRDPSWTGDPG